jgi:hypothetical protein
MGGSSGTRSETGPNVTRERCEEARMHTIPTASTPCVCSSNGSPAAAGAATTTTGSLAGDALNLGANIWIAQNIKNPYTAKFAQSFSQSFLTSFFSSYNEAQRQRQLMNEALLKQQQEAAAKARLAEKQRSDALFARLNSELKISGSSANLALKTGGGNSGELPLKLGDTSDGGQKLKLKLGDNSAQGAGINGLPGIYVGGPANAGNANPDTDGLKLKVGDGSATASATAAGPTPPAPPGGMGIPGLPGIYLNDVPPERAADLANAATNLSGPERQVAEDAALAAAQKNPTLTGPSNDLFVVDYQNEAKTYAEAVQAQQEALQKATEAEGHAQASRSVIEYLGKQVDPAVQTEAQKQAFQQIILSADSDEALAVEARRTFEQTDIRLSIARRDAADSLAVLAAPANTSKGVDTGKAASPASTNPTAVTVNSASGATALPVVNPNHMTVPVLATKPSLGHPLTETPEACVARFTGKGEAKGVPTLEDLQKQLEANITAMERLAKAQEGERSLQEDWSKTLHDARLDIRNNGTDKLVDGLLGVAKTSLEVDKKAYHEALKESMQESQQLHWEHQATAGFGAPNAIVEAKIADYSKRALVLAEQRKTIKGRLEVVEAIQSWFERHKNRRDFYLWATDNAVMPCKFATDGKIDCLEGVQKLITGDTVDRLDQLKLVMKIAVKLAEPAAKFTPYGELAVTTFDLGNMGIDLLYDGFAVYFSKERLQQVRQNDTQLARAREVLGARMDRLTAEIGCYEEAH